MGWNFRNGKASSADLFLFTCLSWDGSFSLLATFSILLHISSETLYGILAVAQVRHARIVRQYGRYDAEFMYNGQGDKGALVGK